MTEIIAAFAEAFRDHWGWLQSASLKATAWLLLAGGVLRMLRKASASVRHTMAVVAAVGVAAIFVLDLSPISERFGWRPFVFMKPVVPVELVSQSTAIHETQAAGAMSLDPGASSAAGSVTSPSAARPWPIDPLGAVVALWCMGLALAGLRLLRRVVKSRPSSIDGPALEDAPAELFALAQREAARLGLNPARVPRLLLADDAMPMLFGLRRPVIVLPSEAIDWPRQQTVSVLRHELLHRRRRDLCWALVVEVALLPAWWHPLARNLKRHAAELTEQACDDAVIASGAAPADYARDLLSLSRRFVPIHPSVLAIPARSGSESGQVARFRRLLDESARRHSLSARWLLAIVSLALALVIPGTLLINCATTEAVDAAESAERQASADAEAAFASAKHPPIDGVAADARQLAFIIKFFEVDITSDPRFAQADVVEWIEGERKLLTPDEGFRLFHPQKKGVDLLSAPKVITRPGEEATIEIGQRIPYVVSEPDGKSEDRSEGVIAVTGADMDLDLDKASTAPLPAGMDFAVAGIYMKVEGRPTGNPTVLQVDLEPSVRDHVGFVEDDNGNQRPEIRVQLRNFKGRFANGSYLSLGVRSDIQSIEDKVPLLGDIPLLGRLFRSEQTREVRRVIAVQVIAEEWK